MKLGTIVTAVPALQKVSGADLSPKTLYKVSKLLSKCDKELDFFNSRKNALVKQYGHQVGNTDEYRVDDENRAVFISKMNEILDIDVEGEISPVVIPQDENIKLSYDDLRLLDDLICIGELEV